MLYLLQGHFLNGTPGAFEVCFGFVGVSCFVLGWVFLLLVGLVLGFLAGETGGMFCFNFFFILSSLHSSRKLILT